MAKATDGRAPLRRVPAFERVVPDGRMQQAPQKRAGKKVSVLARLDCARNVARLKVRGEATRVIIIVASACECESNALKCLQKPKSPSQNFEVKFVKFLERQLVYQSLKTPL